MPDETVAVPKSTGAPRLKRWLAPATILLMSAGIVILITGNWNRRVGDRTLQSTDLAYVRADLTSLRTKVAGLVATVAGSDYPRVRARDLLVQLRDDDFRAQVEQAEAAVRSSGDALVDNRRPKELQGARIAQAAAGTDSAEADIAAAQAGIEAAKSAIAHARVAIDATKADAERTELERRRQEALFAAESATRQKLEQAVAEEGRFGMSDSCEFESAPLLWRSHCAKSSGLSSQSHCGTRRYLHPETLAEGAMSISWV